MKKFNIKEYELMAGIFEYMVKKGLGFCYTQDGRLIGREQAKEYLVVTKEVKNGEVIKEEK